MNTRGFLGLAPRLWLGLGLVFLSSSNLFAGDFWVDGRSGKDLPTHGASAAKPWKTIAYALSRIPAAGPAESHTLFVVGGQSYGTTTNGETFPLVPNPGVAITGLPGGARPIIVIPAKGTGVQLVGTKTYDRRTQLRDLVFEGGYYGVLVDTGARVGPALVDCLFRNQTRISAWLRVSRDAVLDPRVESCNFAGSGTGITIESREHNKRARIDAAITGCVFYDIQNQAIHVQLDETSSSVVDVSVESCRFERAGFGVHLYGYRSALTSTTMAIRGCAFRACDAAVELGAFQGIDATLTIEQCSVLGSANQDGFDFSVTEGRYRCTLRGNYVRGCRVGFGFGGGLGIPGNQLAFATIRSERNLVESCVTGYSGRFFNCTVDWESQGDRALGGGVGFGVEGKGAGTVRIGAAILARTGDGVKIDTELSVLGNGLTVADNATRGLYVKSAGTSTAFESSVFSDNGTEVAGTVTITYSILKKMSHAGIGNRQVDPLLVRPFYKIGVKSPCRDAGRNSLLFPAIDYEGDARTGRWPDVGADEYMEKGSAHVYGVPGLGALGMRPRIASPNLSVPLGWNLHIDLRDAVDSKGAAAKSAVLMVGSTDEPRPFDLAVMGAPSSLLWHDALLVVPPIAITSGGTASLTAKIPLNTQLIGTVGTAQWLVLKADANAAGFVTTDGLRVTIGDKPN